ncbi:MAG: hypothetical protein QM536_00600 [Chitinophagaceae bacterium]|nr:hypothetical protein [Chitinophagaceae bacterium]
MVFVDITNDIAFRKIFGCEQAARDTSFFFDNDLCIVKSSKIIF